MIDLTPHLPALAVIVPMLTAPVVVLLQPRGLAWAAATAASAVSLAIAIALTQQVLAVHTLSYQMGGWPAPYGIELAVDPLSALVLLLISGASTAGLLASRDGIAADVGSARQPMFHAAWLLALAGLSGITVAADAFNAFVFMEVSSLASYVIIAASSDRRALPAAFKYLVMGTIGATFYLIGIGLIYLMTGTLNLSDMESRIHEVGDQRPILVAAGFITIGLGLKAAVFPLHAWLPNAYTYAPHAVSVFLAACSTKVSLYLLLRFDFFVFQENLVGHDAQFALFLTPLAILAILVGSLVALFETNLKRLLAYSSVAQIGYILLGASLVTMAGLTAGILHLFNHALAKGGLFLAVAGLATRLPGVHLNDLAGAARSMPWTMAALVIAALSLIGVPGTAGFISKWYLLTAVLAEGGLGIALVALIVISSLLAVAYVWRILERAYFHEPVFSQERAGAAQSAQGEAPPLLLLTIWVVALANLYFGLQPEMSTNLSALAAETLLQHVP